MSSHFDSLVATALQLGSTRAKMIEVAKLKFSAPLRQMCAQNACGKYDSNWMCPPAVGPFEELKARAALYRSGLLFQTVCQLEDSYDVEGMEAGRKRHDAILRNLVALLRQDPAIGAILPLGAGACGFCPKCSYLDSAAGEERRCRFPDQAMSSVEAYGIDVLHLVSTNGMPYHNGAATVSYVGLVLFNPAGD